MARCALSPVALVHIMDAQTGSLHASRPMHTRRDARLSCPQRAFFGSKNLINVSMDAVTEIDDVRALSRRPRMDAQTRALHASCSTCKWVGEMAPSSALVSAECLLGLQLPHVGFHGRSDQDWRGARYLPPPSHGPSRKDAQTGDCTPRAQCTRVRDGATLGSRVCRMPSSTAAPSRRLPWTR